MANQTTNAQSHTISVLVRNRPGVLARVAGLFSRRSFNIDSLAVSTTQSPDVSRMTIVVQGDERVLDQICKQLRKLIDVLKVQDHRGEELVDRELALIKVATSAQSRGEIMQIVDIFRAQIVDLAANSVVVQVTGDSDKIDALIELLRPFGVKEMMRTGKIVLSRGDGRTVV